MCSSKFREALQSSQHVLNSRLRLIKSRVSFPASHIHHIHAHAYRVRINQTKASKARRSRHLVARFSALLVSFLESFRRISYTWPPRRPAIYNGFSWKREKESFLILEIEMFYFWQTLSFLTNILLSSWEVSEREKETIAGARGRKRGGRRAWREG